MLSIDFRQNSAWRLFIAMAHQNQQNASTGVLQQDSETTAPYIPKPRRTTSTMWAVLVTVALPQPINYSNRRFIQGSIIHVYCWISCLCLRNKQLQPNLLTSWQPQTCLVGSFLYCWSLVYKLQPCPSIQTWRACIPQAFLGYPGNQSPRI